MAGFQRQASRFRGCLSTPGSLVLVATLLMALPGQAKAEQAFAANEGSASRPVLASTTATLPAPLSLLREFSASQWWGDDALAPVAAAVVSQLSVSLSALALRAEHAGGNDLMSNTVVMLDFGLDHVSSVYSPVQRSASLGLTVEHRFR